MNPRYRCPKCGKLYEKTGTIGEFVILNVIDPHAEATSCPPPDYCHTNQLVRVKETG